MPLCTFHLSQLRSHHSIGGRETPISVSSRWTQTSSVVVEAKALYFDSVLDLVLGKSDILFPKLTNVTIPMNSNFNGNTRQNTDTK